MTEAVVKPPPEADSDGGGAVAYQASRERRVGSRARVSGGPGAHGGVNGERWTRCCASALVGPGGPQTVRGREEANRAAHVPLWGCVAVVVVKPGDRLGEYIIEAFVGRGAFGEVWRARHVFLEKHVAVKVVLDQEYARNLQTEAVLQYKIESPYVVRTLGADPWHDPPYLVREYVDGCSLRDLLSARGRLSVKVAVRVGQHILAALQAAHERGIVHRDLKPENVLIPRKGVAKVADFGLGLAKARTTSTILQSGSQSTTSDGRVAGTLDYMAPEQRNGSPVDERADLYAFGAVLFEMLTGQRPSGSDAPSDVLPDIPPWVDDVFRRCYCHVSRRYSNAHEVAAALRDGPTSHQVISPALHLEREPQWTMVPYPSPPPSPPRRWSPPAGSMRTGRPIEATLSLVFGIIGLVLWYIPLIGFGLSGVSVWLSIVFFKKNPDPGSPGRKMTIAGLICGAIGAAFGLLILVALVFGMLGSGPRSAGR